MLFICKTYSVAATYYCHSFYELLKNVKKMNLHKFYVWIDIKRWFFSLVWLYVRSDAFSLFLVHSCFFGLSLALFLALSIFFSLFLSCNSLPWFFGLFLTLALSSIHQIVFNSFGSVFSSIQTKIPVYKVTNLIFRQLSVIVFSGDCRLVLFPCFFVYRRFSSNLIN